jgi:beta-lactam-binding protein with PASTA domain
VFDLLAGLSPVGGDDVMGGGPGQDNHFGEGGDDVFVMSEGSNKFFGDYGFDWVTLRGWGLPQFVELSLLADPLVNLNFNDLRNLYRFVDGASGWDLDDHLAGSKHVLCDPAAAEVAECFIVGMELTAAGAAKVTGLATLMGPTGFNQPLVGNAIPGIKGEGFMGGDILLGGRGSDLLEGKQGDDLIDGDVWLNVQLRAVLNDGTIKLVDDPRDLVQDVFANPQRLSPGNITIVKTIVTPAVPAPDCGSAAPVNCDTAVFSFPLADYAIILNANGTLTVTHVPAVPADAPASDGSDTLRNIERLQFADTTIPAPGAGGGVRQTPVPNVVGLTQSAAETAIVNADLVPNATFANSATVPIGIVISQQPNAGVTRNFGTTINFVVSLGAVVPTVTGLTQAQATNALVAAGLTVGSITQEFSNTVQAGRVISQAPAGGTSVNPGTGIALAISLGQQNRLVPNVVGQTQATATTNIQNAGLVVGTVTFQASATIAIGSVISTSPVAGTSVAPLSAVNLVVSSGAPQPAGLVLALAFDEVTGTTAIDSSASRINGTIRQAVRVPAGKIGGALRFDGVDDWVTVTDTTASPFDLASGMTIEAWVNPSTMSGWETVLMKERGVVGEGLLSYALYAHDGAPLSAGTARPAGYVRTNPVLSTTDSAVRGTGPLALNTWTHLATTYDGANQRFYVNGVLVGTTARTGTIAVSNGAIRIGGNASSTGEFFNGMIDEVRIYNRALTAAEIATDMVTPIVR